MLPELPAPVARPRGSTARFAGAHRGVAGGSEVYRIETNGQSAADLEPRAGRSVRHRVRWAGRAVAGHGEQGQCVPDRIAHRVDGAADRAGHPGDGIQVGRQGSLFAATGNAGKVYEIGPGVEREGSIESDVFDAGMYSLWGRLSFEAKLKRRQGGHLDAQRQPGSAAEEAERILAARSRRRRAGPWVSPCARFVQWKATLTGPIARGNARN